MLHPCGGFSGAGEGWGVGYSPCVGSCCGFMDAVVQKCCFGAGLVLSRAACTPQNSWWFFCGGMDLLPYQLQIPPSGQLSRKRSSWPVPWGSKSLPWLRREIAAAPQLSAIERHPRSRTSICAGKPGQAKCQRQQKVVLRGFQSGGFG